MQKERITDLTINEFETLIEKIVLKNLGKGNSDPLLPRKTVLTDYKVCPATLAKWQNKGLQFIKQGRKVFFRKSELEKYIEDTGYKANSKKQTKK